MKFIGIAASHPILGLAVDMDAIVDGGGCLRLFYLLSVRMISSAPQGRHADYFRPIFCCFEYMEMIFPCHISLQRLRTWLNV